MANLKQFFLLILCFGCLQTSGQFLHPPAPLVGGEEVEITLNSGETITTFLRPQAFVFGLIRSVNTENEKGEKTKYPANEIKIMKVRAMTPSKTRLDENNQNPFAPMLTDKRQVIRAREFPEFYIFEYVQVGNIIKKGGMAQLLNPGFDSRIKVYHDLLVSETTTEGSFSRGGKKSFDISENSDMLIYNVLISKDGQTPVKTDYKKYRRVFKRLLSDCPAVKAQIVRRPWFYDLENHLITYEENCGEDLK